LRRILNAVRSGEMLTQANARINAKDWKGAMEIASSARDKSPTNDNALVMIARIHLQIGQRAEALSALREAVQLNPSNKSQLKVNKQFESLYDDSEFMAIVGSN
jgi:Flp pilus assembly protein TadD